MPHGERHVFMYQVYTLSSHIHMYMYNMYRHYRHGAFCHRADLGFVLCSSLVPRLSLLSHNNYANNLDGSKVIRGIIVRKD